MRKMMSMNLVEAYGVASNVLQLQSKTKKGKKIVVNEKRQLCCSFLHVSQYPVIRIGQKSTMF
jgi:hypothetical protein